MMCRTHAAEGWVLHNARIGELQLAYARAKLQVPSRLRLLARKCNIWSIDAITSRQELQQFWRHTKELLHSGKVVKIPVHKMVRYVWHEVKLHTGFAVSFIFNLIPRPTDSPIAVE